MSFLISKGKFVANGRKFALSATAPTPQDVIYVEDHNINIVSSNFNVVNHDLLTANGCEVSAHNLTMAGGGPGPGPKPEPVPEPMYTLYYIVDNDELRIRGKRADGYKYTYLTYDNPGWLTEARANDVSTVTIEDKIYPVSCYAFFSDLYQLTTINNIANIDTRFCTSMKYMFYNCHSLTRLDLSTFDVSAVTNMENMFCTCKNLETLNIASFNTSNVTTMENMFADCMALTTLDLSNFDTSKVKNMCSMFIGCHALTSLNVTSFDTSNVVDMRDMFSGCWELSTLDIHNFNTANVEDMSCLFVGCLKLTSLDLSNFDVSNSKDMGGLFSSCKCLVTLDLSNFYLSSSLESVVSMFNDCTSLEHIYVNNDWSLSESVDSRYMFENCSQLPNYDRRKTNGEMAYIGGYLEAK